MTDDHVIDIRRYLDLSLQRPHPGVFAVWGGDDERSRFALPLWRVIYLVGGDWGGIVFVSKLEPEAPAQPLFVLDLKQEPARTVPPSAPLDLLEGGEVPAVASTQEGGLAVLLGEDEERRWYLEVQGATSGVEPGGKDRETLLFLAGECAGLLFFRELASPPPSTSSTP